MDPEHDLGSSDLGANTYVLRKRGEVYAMYNDRNGADWKLNLSGASGTFEIKWFDPRLGGSLQNGTVLTVNGRSDSRCRICAQR